MPKPLIQDPAVAGRLASMKRRMDLDAALRGLDEGLRELLAAPASLKALRAGGWPWFCALERELSELQRVLPEVKRGALSRRDQLVAPLLRRLQQLQGAAQRPGDAAALSALNQALFRLDQDMVLAERALEGTFQAPLERSVALRDRLQAGERTLARFKDAGFRLPAGERPLLAVDARWLESAPGAEAPPGVALVSDQRLRFERRDDRVVRRNLGGLAIETKVDRTLLIDEPLSNASCARDTTTGLGRRQIQVSVTWRAGALAGRVSTFALGGGACELAAALEAVRAGRVAAYT